MLSEIEKPVLELESKLRDLQEKNGLNDESAGQKLNKLKNQIHQMKQKLYSNLTPWQRVQIARNPKRPFLNDYIPRIFDDFMELHGDRAYGDDRAIICGLASIAGTSVMVIGHQKGRSLKESMERNFGMPHPEGYRKALRFMKMAEQFHLPILTFVDTPGAYPGLGAEERGQAEAIAKNLREMTVLKVPIIVAVLAEGGSGGALAIAVGDSILMMENSWYSVISPEGCAAILFHDATKAEQAAGALKLTAPDLVERGIVDEMVPEPLGGAHKDPDEAGDNLKAILLKHLKQLSALPIDQLLRNRYEKFRSIGSWQESKPAKLAGGTPSPSRTKKKSKIKPIK